LRSKAARSSGIVCQNAVGIGHHGAELEGVELAAPETDDSASVQEWAGKR
jgi:hypothetical protein